jgi:hypothetical protein
MGAERKINAKRRGGGGRAKIASRLAFGQLLLMRIYQLLMKRCVPLFFGPHGEEPPMASFCAVQIARAIALLRLVRGARSAGAGAEKPRAEFQLPAGYSGTPGEKPSPNLGSGTASSGPSWNVPGKASAPERSHGATFLG